MSYPIAYNHDLLLFSSVSQSEIDPIFKGRLIALAKALGIIIHVTGNGGNREYEEQVKAFIASGGKSVNGTWTGGNGLAAKPGTSNHEYGLAVDIADEIIKKINSFESTDQQYILKAFGLYKPLTQGNKTSVFENWHIQPIEIVGLSISQRKALKPLEVKGTLKEIQKKHGLSPDGIYGRDTHRVLSSVYL